MKTTAVRILSVIMLLALLCSLTACSVRLRPFGRPQEEVCKHEYTSTETYPTCTEDGETVSTCTKCGNVVRDTIPRLGHDEREVQPHPATCTEPGVLHAYLGCSRCDYGLTDENTIAPLGHDLTAIDAVEATCKRAGHTAYEACQREGCTYRVGYEELPRTDHVYESGVCKYCKVPEYSVYASAQAYSSLQSLANGDRLRALYRRIDDEQLKYLRSYTNAAVHEQGGKTYYVVGEYAGGGLTAAELQTVWTAYRTDHPLYFWISAECLTTTGEEPSLLLTTTEAYAAGSARAAVLETVCAGLRDLLAGVPTTGDYEIALALHDRIIALVNYAYKTGTTVPEDTPEAHSIVGCFTDGRVVCEGYAKLYHACLNARGVENRYVVGDAGGDHAWNLVKIGGAGWYWCDLTWDDAPELTAGRRYNYFLKTDDEQTDNETDGGYLPSGRTFAGTHTPGDATPGIGYQYPLPARAETPVGDSAALAGVFLLRSTGTEGGAVYARVGADEVQLIAVTAEADAAGAFTVPETVVFPDDRTVYRVVAIGAQGADGRFGSGAVAAHITSVTIPKSVRTVWYGALAIPTLTEIGVEAESPYFTAGADTDGVLYNDDRTVLVQYPLGAAGTAFTIPDGVTSVALEAFGDGTARAAHLTALVIGRGTERIGVRERGRGYGAATWSDADQELGRIFRINGAALTVTVAGGSSAFRMAGDAVMTAGGTLLLAGNRLDRETTSYTIAAGVTAIGDYAFDAYQKLAEIRYEGTVEALRTIVAASGRYWASGLAERTTPVTEIVCTDGNYTIGG